MWETCLAPGWPQLRSGLPFGLHGAPPRHGSCCLGSSTLKVIPPGAPKARHRFGSEKVSWCLETSLFLRHPSREGTLSLPLLSLFLSFTFFPTSFRRVGLLFPGRVQAAGRLGARIPSQALRLQWQDWVSTARGRGCWVSMRVARGSASWLSSHGRGQKPHAVFSCFSWNAHSFLGPSGEL